MEFITCNNVFIKGHNRLMRIPSKNGIMPVKATKVVSLHKCIKQVLDEFPDVMPKELLNELPLRRQVDHMIKVMPKVAPPTKAPY
jgi:hypothetical protein